MTWDVIVIGTGIGGGTAGRALAEAGQRVLFVEQGPQGHRAEETRLDDALADPVARAIRGFWPDPVTVRLDGHQSTLFAPLGAGVGGSSVFYAATLERPAQHDQDDLPGRPHPTGGWPVSHADLMPWVQRAEALYHVNGLQDPLDPGPALPPGPAPDVGDAALMARLAARGLHPYRLHAAIARLPGCAECLGRKCPRACKMDGRSAGVEPALATGRATLMDRTRVLRILTEGARVTGVEVTRDGQTQTLLAPRVVLAAGALTSPRLMAASGLGGPQVGRNLMFHLNEIFALWPGRGAPAGPSKAVGFRDLYHAQGQRLGMVQAMGVDVGYGEILHHLRQRAARHRWGRVRLAREGLRLPALLAERLLGRARLFVGLLEDMPYAHNRVLPDADRIVIDYTLSPELLARRALFRRLIRRACGPGMAFLGMGPEPNWGHPCGTLRMGRDPDQSVTDGWGRVHGVGGLWVADAAVFPTAMGVNPSLTIAAHALRVAHDMTGGRE